MRSSTDEVVSQGSAEREPRRLRGSATLDDGMRAYGLALRRWWYVAVLGLVLGSSLGAVLATLLPPEFVASSQVELKVSPAESGTLDAQEQQLRVERQRAINFGATVRADGFIERVLEQASVTDATLDSWVIPGTSVIRFEATAGSRAAAIAVADAAAEDLESVFRSEMLADGDAGARVIHVTSGADGAHDAAQPSWFWPAVAGLMGLGIGLGLAFMLPVRTSARGSRQSE